MTQWSVEYEIHTVRRGAVLVEAHSRDEAEARLTVGLNTGDPAIEAAVYECLYDWQEEPEQFFVLDAVPES